MLIAQPILNIPFNKKLAFQFQKPRKNIPIFWLFSSLARNQTKHLKSELKYFLSFSLNHCVDSSDYNINCRPIPNSVLSFHKKCFLWACRRSERLELWPSAIGWTVRPSDFPSPFAWRHSFKKLHHHTSWKAEGAVVDVDAFLFWPENWGNIWIPE